MDLSCEPIIPKIQGLDDDILTVGRKFILRCQGEISFPREGEVSLITPENPPHTLDLLSTHILESGGVDLEVASYRVGEHQIKSPILRLGDQEYKLKPISFQVVSVIEKRDEVIEPYGAFGPFSLPLPWGLILALVFLFLSLSLVFFWTIRRRIERKRIEEKLRQHDSALSPLQEFFSGWRRLQRENEVYHGGLADAAQTRNIFDELRRMVLVFLTRRFRIPAFEWTSKVILRQIRGLDRKGFRTWGQDLNILLREIDRASSTPDLSAQDVVKLTEQARRCVEKIGDSEK
ncbi:MAG: hypothetical protein N2578_09625 [Bdellovibrionaceae bacterium]|nr:hypothetical protein [Pseudobdellovibrionaceae bacterium]